MQAPRSEYILSSSDAVQPPADEAGRSMTGSDPKQPAPGRPPARRSGWRIFGGVVLVLLLAGGGWWYGWGRGAGRDASRTAATAPPPARVPVEIASASKGDIPINLDGLGTVTAFNTVTVRSRVDGELIEIAFQEGQTVREGDLLARIDPRPYKAALDQAVARKTQNEATVASTKLDLARTRELASRSFASQQQLDQQSANVAAQMAQIQSDQAAIESAQTQLGYTTIRAPLSGRLGLRLTDRGNIVRASDATGIVEIAQLQPISVLFTAPESQLGEILAAKSEGDVKVMALASDGRTVLGEGVLALVNNTVDTASGTVRLKATFPNTNNKLWPGLSINTRLLVRTLKDVLSVPDTAIIRGPEGLFAFKVAAEDKVEKQVLSVGAITDGRAVILDGVRDGDRVITAGQSRLQPGTRVEAAGGAGGHNKAADASARPVR